MVEIMDTNDFLGVKLNSFILRRQEYILIMSLLMDNMSGTLPCLMPYC